MYKKTTFTLILLLITTGVALSNGSKIAEVDSTTLAYYKRCTEVHADPIVISMADTLYRMAEENGDKRMQAVALCTKLDYYYYNQQRDSITKWTKQVQQFAKETNQPKYYYFVWGARLINHYLHRKEYNIALQEAEKMLKESETEDYKEGIASCYNVLANIYSAKGLIPQSIEFSLKEIEIFEKYNLDRYNISLKYGFVGEKLVNENRFEEAQKYFAEGEKYANTPFQKVYLKLSRTKSYVKSGDLGQANKLLKEAQQLFATTPSLEVRNEILHRTEIIYYNATKEYNKALKAFDAWEKTIELRQLEATKSSFYHSKGNLYWEMGRNKDAAEAYRKLIEITQKEKLESEEITAAEIATLLNLQRLNTEKKDLEKLTKERHLQYTIIIIILLSTILAIVVYFLCRQRRFNRKLKKSRDMLNEKNITLVAAEEELRKAKEIAEKNCEMKDIFIQNISHEIRTPLNAIVGFSTILSELCPKEEVRVYADTIEANSQLLLQMINDIIEISNLDHGDSKIKCEPVYLNECGDVAIEEARKILSDGVELSFTSLTGNPAVNTDRRLVMQVLKHLLSNAAKFTPSGGITLIIKVDKKSDEVRFIVSDTGIGIPKERQKDVFERFVKLNDFTQGNGLGLSISRLSAEKLNGYLVIDEEYTLGTRFVFGIPLK